MKSLVVLFVSFVFMTIWTAQANAGSLSTELLCRSYSGDTDLRLQLNRAEGQLQVLRSVEAGAYSLTSGELILLNKEDSAGSSWFDFSGVSYKNQNVQFRFQEQALQSASEWRAVLVVSSRYSSAVEVVEDLFCHSPDL